MASNSKHWLASTLLGITLAGVAQEYLTPYLTNEVDAFKFEIKTSQIKLQFPNVPSNNDLDVMTSKNIFNSKGLFPARISEEERRRMELAKLPPERTSLPVKLIGTVVVWKGLDSIASLEFSQDNVSVPVKVGEKVNDMIEILSIEPKKVIFTNLATSRKEFIDIPDDDEAKVKNIRPTFRENTPAPPIAQTKDGFQVPRTLIQDALKDPMKFLNDASATPEKQGEQVIGWKIFNITPGSLYEHLGLKDFDVITTVNGQLIPDGGTALNEFKKLGSANKVNIVVLRAGQKVNLNYAIK